MFNTSFKKCFPDFCGKLSAKRGKPDPGGRTSHGLESVRWVIGVFRKMLRQRNLQKIFAGVEKDRGCSRRKEIFDCCVDLRLCRDRRHCFCTDGADAKEYLVPKSICDYSRQEVYYLDEEAAVKERTNGSEVLYYMGEETPMFRFSGVTVTVEWMRV